MPLPPPPSASFPPDKLLKDMKHTCLGSVRRMPSNSCCVSCWSLEMSAFSCSPNTWYAREQKMHLCKTGCICNITSVKVKQLFPYIYTYWVCSASPIFVWTNQHLMSNVNNSMPSALSSQDLFLTPNLGWVDLEVQVNFSNPP